MRVLKKKIIKTFLKMKRQKNWQRRILLQNENYLKIETISTKNLVNLSKRKDIPKNKASVCKWEALNLIHKVKLQVNLQNNIQVSKFLKRTIQKKKKRND